MTYYLDKVNNVLFIKPNAKIELNVVLDMSKAFEETGIPYTVIISDHDDELVII
ncbi:hypothetical protein ACFP67_10800 [Mammaliicoccus sciuri]|uniref:hypothetical protein n=1 Tax=Mammaliicoccus sciuri TaxID=1296 RepID=UPI0015E1B9D6|nr:hypothetical protein [Mammaliicoccus sciuri]